MVDKLLESIEFPDSLESIGYCAFSCYRGGTYSTYVASNLKSVKFGSGLKQSVIMLSMEIVVLKPFNFQVKI